MKKPFNKRLKSILLLFAMVFSLPAYAGRLDKAFERLMIHDYFRAKGYFEKELKKNPTPAAFGLSIIYSRNNNPFFHIDSARKYLLMADSSFIQLSEKHKIRLQKWKIDSDSITSLKSFICSLAFRKAETSASVDSLNHFLSQFDFCEEHQQALALRNKIAFDQARKENTTAAYQSFLEVYPEASEREEAKSLYEQRLFEEFTASHSLASYE
ncbi:MAG: hypothetical protein JNL47_04405, partial [Bacteroidia bacterium]|nr:hypothetical protein [Bacteroidia bacterium]